MIADVHAEHAKVSYGLCSQAWKSDSGEVAAKNEVEIDLFWIRGKPD